MDPHAVLGVSKAASKDEIKAAYRKLCFQHHPDRHAMSPEHVQKSAATSFKAITEAYEVLMDDSRRHAHTRSGGRAAGYGSAGGPRGYGRPSYSAEYASYSGYSGANYSGYNQFRRRTGFSFASLLRGLSTGMTRQEALATLVVAGAMLGGAVLLEPVVSSFWERQNQGKLFRDIEQEVVRAQAQELQRLRALRAARQQAQQQAAEAAQQLAQQEPVPMQSPGSSLLSASPAVQAALTSTVSKGTVSGAEPADAAEGPTPAPLAARSKGTSVTETEAAGSAAAGEGQAEQAAAAAAAAAPEAAGESVVAAAAEGVGRECAVVPIQPVAGQAGTAGGATGDVGVVPHVQAGSPAL